MWQKFLDLVKRRQEADAEALPKPLPSGYVEVFPGEKGMFRWQLYGPTTQEDHDEGGRGTHLAGGQIRGHIDPGAAYYAYKEAKKAMMNPLVRMSKGKQK